MKFLGYNSVQGLIEKRVKDAAITNPGPLRQMSFRFPVHAEARLIALSELLGVPKSALLRDLLMTSLIEAEDAMEDILEDEEAMQDYRGRCEAYEHALLEGSEVEPQAPMVRADVADVRVLEEES